MTAGETIDVVVRKIEQETSLIRSFVLEPKPGQSLPEFEPGAHVDVFLAPGVIRNYSLVNDPADRSHYRLGVKREINGRGGSIAMHQLKEGDTLRISHAKSNFALRDAKGRSFLLAGGIGVTPLLSMAQALSRQGTEFEFHYFTSSREERAFCNLINGAAWARNVAYHYGVVPPALDDLLEEVLGPWTEDDSVYLCGPGPFMDTICAVAERLGWPREAVVRAKLSC